MIDWNKVNLPGDMDRDAILVEIAEVSRIKATQHCSSKHPAFFSYDDLYQEIFVKCVQVLPKFEESKSFGSKHRLFFYRCADNLILDMKRKHLFYRSSPCKNCESEMKEGDSPEGFHERDKCPLVEKHLKLNKAKRDLGWSFGSVGMENSDHNKDEPDNQSSSGPDEPLSKEERVLEIELNDEMRGRLGEVAYLAYRKLVDENYETAKLNPSELKMLRKSLSRIYNKKGGRNV